VILKTVRIWREQSRDWNVLIIVCFALFSRLLLAAIAYLSYASTANKNVLELVVDPVYMREFATPLSYGDITWYMDIAENGYENKIFSESEKANWSFYPLWPLLLRLSNLVFSEMLISGILISTLFFTLGLVYLYKLVSLDFDAEVGSLAAVLLIVFPSSYFFLRPGPESLFLFLVISAFYFARKENWLLAGFLAGLATLTRLQGVLLLIPLLFLYYRQFRKNRAHNWQVLSLLLIPAAQLGFMLHLQSLTGNLFASVHMQRVWDNNLEFPFTAVVEFLAKPVLISYYGWDLTVLSFITVLITVGLLFTMIKIHGIPPEYIIYTAMSVYLIVARGNLNGTLRFLLVIFPIFIVLAILLKGRKFASELVIYTLSALQIFYFLSFIHFYNWAAT
jgi:Gpi18-like mannosyltransferase